MEAGVYDVHEWHRIEAEGWEIDDTHIASLRGQKVLGHINTHIRFGVQTNQKTTINPVDSHSLVNIHSPPP